MNLSSELAKTLAFTYRNVVMVRRNIFFIAEVFYWPFISLLSMGFMLSYLAPGERGAAVVMTGVAAFSALQACQLDVAYSLLFDMWSKSMKHTMAAPVRSRHYLLGSWVVGIARGTATLLVVGALMRAFFHFDLLRAGTAAVAVFWAGLMLCGLLIGMLTIVCLYTFGFRAEIIPWSIVSLLLLVCGFYYPVDVLPPALGALGRAIPLTYFLEAYRAAFGLGAAPGAAAKGFLLCGVYGAAIYALLGAAERRAKRRGFILKMSE